MKTNEQLAREFVLHYPQMFTEDIWFWENKIKELLDAACSQKEMEVKNDL